MLVIVSGCVLIAGASCVREGGMNCKCRDSPDSRRCSLSGRKGVIAHSFSGSYERAHSVGPPPAKTVEERFFWGTEGDFALAERFLEISINYA